MQKLLTIWMEDQIQKRAPLILMMIQVKARSLFKVVQGKYSDLNAKFEDRTYISKEKTTMPGFKAVKDRLMHLLGANAKLKQLLVYHSENPCAFKGLSKATLPVHFHSNSKAWMTTELIKDWFMNFFFFRSGKILQKKQHPVQHFAYCG
jgi:hypothetical protein